MRSIINNTIISVICIGMLIACTQEGTTLYEQYPAVYFTESTYSYTFLQDADSLSKKIHIQVDISGSQVNYDRTFDVCLLDIDSLNMAEADQFTLGKGIVKANQVYGNFEIELKKDDRLKDTSYFIALEIVPGKDFPEVRLNKKTMLVEFTNKVIKPANWTALSWAFDQYSTRWWTFICSTLDLTFIPYNPFGDPEIYYMDDEYMRSYWTIVRLALDDYNNAHYPDVLTHDDGKAKGQPCAVVPNF